jgi:WD40 repeat protein
MLGLAPLLAVALPTGAIAQPKEKATLKGHTGFVYSVAYSPDGKTLASGSYDKSIKLWDVATGRELATLKGNTDAVCSVAYSPNGKTLAAGSGDLTGRLWSGDHDGMVKLSDVATGRELATLKGNTDAVFSVAYSPDGKTLASGSWDDTTIKLWDVETCKERATLKGHTEIVNSFAYSPDGKTLASGSWDSTVKLWSVAT